MGFLEDFRKFAMRGNMIDLAIGFTVGAAFSTIARSLVDDILLPPISLLTGQVEFSDRFVVLQQPEGAADAVYTTLQQAQEAGATTLKWGLFVNNLLTFVIVALAMFFIIRMVTRLDRVLEDELDLGEEEKPVNPPDDKKCPYCVTTIPRRATRCPNCTSDLAATPVLAEAGPA